jgi:transcription elongation GreA/GreB family factor
METNESACELLFYDEDNDEVKIQNSTIYLINDAGEEIPITILKEYDIEFEKNK